jgi:hypothetical protein
MDPITAFGIASSVAGLADLAGTVFLEIFQYCKDVKQAPTKSKELRDEVQTISNLLDSLTTLLKTSSTGERMEDSVLLGERFKETTVQCKAFLDELNKRVPKKSLGFWLRVKWPFTKVENDQLLEKIGRYKETFIWALSMYQTYISDCQFND